MVRVRAPLVVNGANSILNKVFLPASPLHRYVQQFLLKDEQGKILPKVKYEIYKGEELLIKGKTDNEGLTAFVGTENSENIRICIIHKEENYGCCDRANSSDNSI